MESLGKKRMTACVSVGLPLLSDEIFFPALIHSFLKGRVIFQSGVCAFGKFRSLCFIGMVGALVPVHVSQHHHQKENQDKNYSCNDTSYDCKISSCWRVSNICRRVRCWTVMGRHPVCIEKWPPLFLNWQLRFPLHNPKVVAGEQLEGLERKQLLFRCFLSSSWPFRAWRCYL